MRNLNEVIDQIVNELPENMTELKADLAKISESAFFTPPEGMYLRWRDVGLLLDSALGNPTGVAWKEAVQKIINSE